MVVLVMAWSPVQQFNAGWFEVDHPGDYATLIPTNPATPRTGLYRFIIALHVKDGPTSADEGRRVKWQRQVYLSWTLTLC